MVITVLALIEVLLVGVGWLIHTMKPETVRLSVGLLKLLHFDLEMKRTRRRR